MSDELPTHWNHGSTLPDDMLAVILASECPWLQVVSALTFTLAAMLADCEDDAMRVAAGETVTAALLETARTGRIPGWTLQ
jgi:hypothetical protein